MGQKCIFLIFFAFVLKLLLLLTEFDVFSKIQFSSVMFCSRMQGPRVSEPRREFLNVLGRHLPVEPA